MDLMLSPLTLAILGGAGMFAARIFGRNLTFLFAAGLFGFAMLLMTPMAANLLVGAIEGPASTTPMNPALACGLSGGGTEVGTDAVVMLTGGFDRPPRDVEEFGALSRATLVRTFAFLQLEIPPEVDIFIVGGGPFTVSEADVVARLMIQLGLEPARLTVEPESRNTLENAHRAAELLLPENPRIVLATDALHMPRAAFAFEESGFQVCRQPLTSYYVRAFGLTALIPQAGALDKSRRALREIAATIYYRASIPHRPLTRTSSR